MTRPFQTTKLLAVVLVGCAPAPASPPAPRAVVAVPARPDPWQRAATSTPDAAAPPVAALAAAGSGLVAMVSAAVPRRLKSGAPACGNVVGKAPMPGCEP